jgi:hypothetical protein
MSVASGDRNGNSAEDALIAEEFRRFRKEPGLSFLRFVAESATYANRVNIESWVITKRPGGATALIRLNIAQWRAVDLQPDQPLRVGVVVLGEELSAIDRWRLRGLGAEIRREQTKLPGMQYVVFALSNMRRAAPAVAGAHQAFIDIALERWKGRSSWWRSHSVALVRFLRKVLQRNDLLQPGYVRKLRGRDDESLSEEAVFDRAVEQCRTESAVIPSGQRAGLAFRREAKLLTEYAAYLACKGQKVQAKAIKIFGEQAPIRCDLYNETRKQLVEAK